MMDPLKKILLFHIPMSICNFRCCYCYLAQRKEHYQGEQVHYKYTPKQVAQACSPIRLGGPAFMNFCADGETLLAQDIDLYIRALVAQGHYAEIVTNMTITPMINKILEWPDELLSRVEFKASFHYLELKKKNMLHTYAENVKKAWERGASVNIEMTPHDELVPYIDEVKRFSIENFGALPHLTIARNDNTEGIEYLTDFGMEEYDKTWSIFHSEFWEFKKSIFGKYQDGYCYAGMWSAYVNLATGMASSCYCGGSLGDVFKNPKKPFPQTPVGKCTAAHCYNGHALMTLGLIPKVTDVRYGDIRDREREDGRHWLQPGLKAFFNCRLYDSNAQMTSWQKAMAAAKYRAGWAKRIPGKVYRKIFGRNRNSYE